MERFEVEQWLAKLLENTQKDEERWNTASGDLG